MALSIWSCVVSGQLSRSLCLCLEVTFRPDRSDQPGHVISGLKLIQTASIVRLDSPWTFKLVRKLWMWLVLHWVVICLLQTCLWLQTRSLWQRWLWALASNLQVYHRVLIVVKSIFFLLVLVPVDFLRLNLGKVLLNSTSTHASVLKLLHESLLLVVWLRAQILLDVVRCVVRGYLGDLMPVVSAGHDASSAH